MVEKKKSSEATVRNIRRKTRKKYSAEEKIRIVLDGLRGRRPSLSYAGARGSTKTCITSGAKNSWKLANSAWPVTPTDRRPVMK